MEKELMAISPIDGRYFNKIENLNKYFSEYALFKKRIFIEIEYLISLGDIEIFNKFTQLEKEKLRNIYNNFNIKDAEEIKKIESTTRHDIKSVEYFIKNKMSELGMDDKKEWVHFGLTSQDINNTSIPLLIKESIQESYLPNLEGLISKLRKIAKNWSDITMLSHTHGQPASPTTIGKEIMVFVERIESQKNQLLKIPFEGKFGGATGNFNAHHVCYPTINWINFSNRFLDGIGLNRQQFTTQIEHYDNMASQFDCIRRINNILINFCRDIWTYISMEYFKQKVKNDEVGSSAMPHKVNPIDFENAEGNLGMANSIFDHLSNKLPISRLQRDLTDSTVLRNIGVPFSHTILSIKSILSGLDKLIVNEDKVNEDLSNNWVVVSEAIQNILRREGYKSPYEKLKELTRNNLKIQKIDMDNFIDSLEISDNTKSEMKQITPFNYKGINPYF